MRQLPPGSKTTAGSPIAGEADCDHGKNQCVMNTIKINCKGGVISPGQLYNLMVACEKAGIHWVKFGLRQQLIIPLEEGSVELLKVELNRLEILYETDGESYPNITSSYPAVESLMAAGWLTENVYKDVLDAFEYRPQLKINICAPNQSFTPMVTGNINWIADPEHPHYWHLKVRFPKTNSIADWNRQVYTNDLARFSELLELKMKQIRFNEAQFDKDIQELLDACCQDYSILHRYADKPCVLPAFNLPYYEGLNKWGQHYWLGVYRRNEQFACSWLKELAILCLETKIGQVYTTPWKSIILKGIQEADRGKWTEWLDSCRLNLRHAANELNFQVEDDCAAALRLKEYLVKKILQDDLRSFGLCLGIKTRQKSEIYSSLLIRRRPLFKLKLFSWWPVYDIVMAQGYNPNERSEKLVSASNPKWLLYEQLRRAVVAYYQFRERSVEQLKKTVPVTKKEPTVVSSELFACKQCGTLYDVRIGDPAAGIPAGTSFSDLPATYCCALCEESVEGFESYVKS
jgi:rubredoxin